MYAVIRDKGKEFMVREGDIVNLEKHKVEKGEPIEFDEVLLYSGDDGVEVGTPTVSDIKVTAQVLGETKGEKLIITKFRRRKSSRTRRGHRQTYTTVKITGITKS